MADSTGSGVAVGLASSEAQVQQSGGLNMFTIFPKLLIPIFFIADTKSNNFFLNTQTELHDVNQSVCHAVFVRSTKQE